MELINTSAIRAITDDRLRTADAARLVAETRPVRGTVTARLDHRDQRPGRPAILGRLHLHLARP